MELFRKHKKAIYWVIIALVGVPFIFIGTGFTPFSNRNGAGMVGGTETVATVAGMPVQADELREALSRQNQAGAEAPDNQMLLETGKVDDALNNLVKSRLVENEANSVKLAYDREYLAEALKKDPSFQNEQGQVDPEKWNSFVREQREMGANWDAIYESVQNSINRNVMAQRVLSSARVSPQEVRDQFERENTKYTLKYVAVEPKVEPTEEQLKAHYEENKANYDIPAQRKVDFIAIPTGVPRPAQLDDFVQQAREGKDFETIAKSAPENLNAMGRPGTTWIPEDQVPPDLSVLLTMQAGEVSEPIETPAGYVICRVEEARIVPETAKRELRVSMMSIAPQLTPEEREAQDAKVAAIAAAAKDGDLAAAAAQAGVPVLTTDSFSVKSTAIQNVPEEDTIVFAQGMDKVEQGKVSEPIRGRENTYVAKVAELIPAVPQPLDAVRDRVVADTVAALKMEAEYKTKQQQLATEIAQKAANIDGAKAQFPDALTEVKQAGPFTVKTYDFQSGPFWNAQDVVEKAAAVPKGKLAGPVSDFMGGQYLVEVVDAVAPDEKAWNEDFPKEKDTLRKSLLARRQGERFEDYVGFLMLNANVSRNEEAILRALGLDEESRKAQAEYEKKQAEEAAGGAPAAAGDAATTTPAT